MRQIIYGPLCMLQDPRVVLYDRSEDWWYLDEAVVNTEFCAVANAGAVGIRIMPWGPWEAHPYGIKSQFQPYIINDDKYDLSKFNTYYFPIVKKVIQIARKYGMKTWWCWFDNCQFAGSYRRWSPWVTNLQNITTVYDSKAYPFLKTWIQRCETEFAGLDVRHAWANEGNNIGMQNLVRNVVWPMMRQYHFDPKKMTYGATMKAAPYINGEYLGDAGMLDQLKKITGTEFGDPTKLAIWKEVHSVGGKGYPAVPNLLNQALQWWARPMNNGVRIWLSDDGVWDGDSACDFEASTGRRRPSATRWAAIVKATKGYGNDFTYEHLPKGGNLACQIQTLKAIYKALNGVNPIEKYHYTA